MPLRDHFRPPLDTVASWEELHGQWPATIVQHLRKILPTGYVAGPRVHAGSQFGIDVEPGVPDNDEYEVRVYDARRNRRLVAAIELVSPASKDRVEKRNAFIAKCTAMLRNGEAVTIVDVVTTSHFNLYADLMAFLGHSDPTLGAEPSPLYAASCRCVRKGERAMLETWSHALAVGRVLPTLPLWLSDVRAVPLDLEQSYEQACDDLSIR